MCLLKNGSLGPLRSGGLIALALVTENVVERQLSDLGVKLFGPPDLIVKYPGETVQNFVRDAFSYAIGKRSSNMMAS